MREIVGPKDPRNYGLDLLKIIAMYMVAVIHIMGHGGVLHNVEDFSANYVFGWSLEAVVICAVDIYVIISGYLYAGRTRKLKNIVYLWMTVLFYSVLVPIAFSIAGYEIGIKSLIKDFFPVLFNKYWFFTQYFALFLVIPFLNTLLADKKTALRVLVIGTFLLSITRVLALGADLYFTNGGYSFLWFVMLYCWGGYLKLYGVSEKITNKTAILLLIVSVFMIASSKIILSYLTTERFGEERYAGILIGYNSPFVLLSAICWVVLFSRIKINAGSRRVKIAETVSAATFGIYLIHENPAFRSNVISDRFIGFAGDPAGLMIIKVLGVAALVFLACFCVDLLRSWLFKLLRIKKISNAVGEKITSLADQCYNKML